MPIVAVLVGAEAAASASSFDRWRRPAARTPRRLAMPAGSAPAGHGRLASGGGHRSTPDSRGRGRPTLLFLTLQFPCCRLYRCHRDRFRLECDVRRDGRVLTKRTLIDALVVVRTL